MNDSTRSGTRTLRELDGMDLQHLRAQARHLQHLLEADGVQPPRLRHHPWVGGVDAVDIRVDEALVSPQGSGYRYGRSIRLPRPSVVIDLRPPRPEAGDDHHLAGGEIGTHAGVVDALDARLGVCRVGFTGTCQPV